MSNALIFSTGKVVGGGIMPKINEFKTAAAYEDDGRIVVIPFPSSANDNVEVYYSASLSGTLKDHIVSVFKAENIVRSKFDAGSCIASVWRPGRVADDNISVNDKHRTYP